MFKEAAAVAMMALLGAPSPAEVIKTGPGTRYYDGAPPARFIKQGIVPVMFVNPALINEACGIGNLPGLTLLACTRRTKEGVAVVIMPHPAAFMDSNGYALVLAHEIAHANGGWSGSHEL